MTNLDDYAPRCKDERCEVKSSCPLYLDRDNPNARLTADTAAKGQYNGDQAATPSKGVK